ncbi:MAG: ABC transporter permease [Planctomycetota bacterium]|nr:MAG: ABC transporter permease [Planctomycetota bacterium]
MQVWTIARHTIAEGLRMKLALVFLGLIALVVLGLPFSVTEESSLTMAIQAFLSYALNATGFLLGLLTIFLSRSVSDDLVRQQIFLVVSKPVSRWHYIVGKWLGVTLMNVMFLAGTGLTIYGMVHVIRRVHPPLDPTFDRAELEHEVLVARHAIGVKVPYDEFARQAEREVERNIEEGVYDNVEHFNREEEKRRLMRKYEARWRVVGPEQMRVFTFENVLVDRRRGAYVQIRYKTEVTQYPPDEIFRALWIVGDQAQGTPVYRIPVRQVVGRFHTIRFPADAVAKDGTLTAYFYNRNPYPDEPQYNNVIEFRKSDGIEALFVVGAFAGNFVRLLLLMLCKLMFLGAVSMLMVTMFSYPVACLASLTVYTLAGTRGFLMEALDFLSDDRATLFTSVKEFFLHLIMYAFQAFQWLIPDFAYYDGIETLVTGRNVGLVWVLNGVVWLGVVQTGILLGLAVLLFHRREVAEVSF